MTRFSQVQKELLIVLAKAFMGGVKKAKSTDLNALVNKNLRKEIHPNNWRVSCQKLEERGLIMRGKEDLDWYIWIAPKGFEQALNWLEEQQNKE